MNQTKFNNKKSCRMQIGHKSSTAIYTGIMSLNRVPIDWVTNFKCLGVAFIANNSLVVDCSYIKRKFYAACMQCCLSKMQICQ